MCRLDDMLALVHSFIAEILPKGGQALDATAGNGKDTLFLARQVGTQGRVWALDIQTLALQRTRELLSTEGMLSRVCLLQIGHENLHQDISEKFNAIMFNLGYLPRGRPDVFTKTDSTIAALDQALGLLLPGGRMSVVCYPGHAEGWRETQAVTEYGEHLPSKSFTVLKWQLLNRKNKPPQAVIIEKIK